MRRAAFLPSSLEVAREATRSSPERGETEAIEEPEQGALSRAVRADDGQVLALVDGQGNIA